MTSNASALLRSYVIYGLCLPLAIILGYMLTSPDVTTVITVATILCILVTPVVIKWHHPLLILSWNMSAVLFFLPGRPYLWLAMSGISLGVSILQRALSRGWQLPPVRSVALPLLLLGLTAFVTAKLTGGIGLKSLGGDVYGGKRYFILFGTIVGFFALSQQRIPLESANLLASVFFLSGITTFIGSLTRFIAPGVIYYIFLLFPVEILPGAASGADYVFRSFGLAWGCTAVFWFMLARYGIRGILDLRRPWRVVLFVGISYLGLLGGFRSTLIIYLLTFTFQFFLEGLHRTHFLAIVGVCAVLCAVLGLAFARDLPHSVQRTLAVVPGVDIDPAVRIDAEGSSQWRINMWKNVLPQVPHYLLLGKGYAMDPSAMSFYQFDIQSGFAGETTSFEDAGDYHNGPLSVIMPLGLWGVGFFLWFLWAGFRLLLANHRYGNPELRHINTCFLAIYLMRVVMFLFVFGSLYSDLAHFVGVVALSISLNGGMRRQGAEEAIPETPAVPATIAIRQRPVPSPTI